MSIRLLYQFPTWLQRLYRGVVWRMNPSSKVVYLTFDDGPIPECTPQVLEILAQYGVKATFFMVADNAQQHPELLQRILQDGHAVGNHTFHHMRGCRNNLDAYLADVEDANQLLQTQLFRPPHGRMRIAQKKELLRKGYQIYLWDVLTHDYNPCYSTEKMLAIIQKYTRNGSIIVLHDSIKSMDRMLPLLPLAIEWLKENGYTFATLSEL